MTGQPIVERLTIKNYRALRDVELRKLTPLTVLLGPNGSGKSTVMDAVAFLHESFTTGLRAAWDKRNRMQEIRSRGQTGPVFFEIQYREGPGERLVTYQLTVDEVDRRPVVADERMRWVTSPGRGRPREILTFHDGAGTVYDETTETYENEQLDSPDLLAVSTLGQLSRHPRVVALRRFISGWYLSYLSADSTRSTPQSGPQSRLTPNGDNLPNVVQHLQEQHPQVLADIASTLSRRVPHLERLVAETLADGRLLLQLKDQPFEQPILSRFASDGTLKLFAYLIVLNGPEAPSIVGIEEPENQLHPRLLPLLAEEARQATARSQLIVTTHSPEFANALAARELWVVYRAGDGFTRVRRASDIPQVETMMQAGALLGDLWMEGYFDVGDPLAQVTA